MKKVLFAILLVSGLAFTLDSCSKKTAPTTDSKTTSFDATKVMGSCRRCHGGDLMGNAKTPSLVNTSLNADQLTNIIKNGKNKMPAFAGDFNDTEIKGIVNYLLSLKK